MHDLAVLLAIVIGAGTIVWIFKIMADWYIQHHTHEAQPPPKATTTPPTTQAPRRKTSVEWGKPVMTPPEQQDIRKYFEWHSAGHVSSVDAVDDTIYGLERKMIQPGNNDNIGEPESDGSIYDWRIVVSQPSGTPIYITLDENRHKTGDLITIPSMEAKGEYKIVLNKKESRWRPLFIPMY